jgi:uncharacterized protein (TIGR02996 family)
VLAGIAAARYWDLRWLSPGSLEGGLHAALVERAGRRRAARAAIAAARVASRREHLGAALKQAREAAALNPEDAFLERMLQAMEQEAAFRLARGDFTGAARRFGDVLGILPERPTALYGAALADRGLGRAESAFLHLARAVAARPEEATFRLALADNLREQGREEEALGQYRQLLEREPEHAAALLGLAELLSRAKPPLRDMPGAIRAAEQAARLTGYRDRRIAMTLADLYIAEGRVLEGVSLKRRLKITLP